MALLPQIPQNWEGSGNLMGQVFLENLTLFLEMVALSGVKVGVVTGVKMGTLSGLNLRIPLKWGSFWGSKWWPFLGSKWWPFLGSKWGNSWLPQSSTYSHYYHFT